MLVALLSARTGASDGSPGAPSLALLDFGGQPLIEYQARLALGAGAERLLIYVDAAQADAFMPDLTRMVDRLAGACDCPVSLVRNMPDLARSLAAQDHVLLLAEGVVLPAESLDALLDGELLEGELIAGDPTGSEQPDGDWLAGRRLEPSGPQPVGEAITVIPSVASTAGLERIDAGSMWGGALCVSGARVLATLDMLGEWDLVLTLLRRAVQDGARRVTLEPEMITQSRLAFVTDQTSADIALEALTDYGPELASEQNGWISGLLAPFARTIVRELMRRQVEPSRVAVMALLLAVGALALEVSAWTLPAFMLMLPALGLAAVAERGAQLTLRASGTRWQYRFVHGVGLLMLTIIGIRLSEGNALALIGAAFPIFFITLFTFADEHMPPVAGWYSRIQPSVAGALLLVLIGVLIGLTGSAFALLGLLVMGILTLRLFQIEGRGI